MRFKEEWEDGTLDAVTGQERKPGQWPLYNDNAGEGIGLGQANMES